MDWQQGDTNIAYTLLYFIQFDLLKFYNASVGELWNNRSILFQDFDFFKELLFCSWVFNLFKDFSKTFVIFFAHNSSRKLLFWRSENTFESALGTEKVC